MPEPDSGRNAARSLSACKRERVSIVMNTVIVGSSRLARIALRAGACTVALGFASQAALAQESTAAPQAEQATDSADAGNEIIVTATKREQTLQDVPVAVSVTTAETIERAQIRDIRDLQSVVPSLRVSQSQGQFATTYSIRGFGTSGNNIGLEPSVAVFVDGVYRSRAIAQISDLPDIQRVEVLRGPQSTLFGKNASAGVISIVTQKPKFDFGGNVEAVYGNYNAVVLKGVVTGPITQTVAASLAAGYNRRDGYLKNVATGSDVNDRNRWFARGQLLFEPDSALSIRLIGDYDELDEVCCGVSNLRPSAATLAVRAVGGLVNDATHPFNNQIYSDVNPSSKVRNWGASGQVDYDFGGITATSITAYRDTRLRATQDVDFTSARLATGANIGAADLKTFTQELRLASDFDGPLNFLLGGYYFDEKAKSADQIVYGADFRRYVDILSGGGVAGLERAIGVPVGTFFPAGQGFFNKFTQRDKAYSIFGNVDFKPIDRLTITLGANYTRDRKNVASNSVSTDAFSALNLAGIRNQLTAGAIAQTIAPFFGLPAGSFASAAQVAAFAQANPAGFAQIQAGASNATAPILGLRPLQFLPPLLNFPNAIESGRTRDGKWTYTARLAYEVSDTLNVYASYATGFKASSFNLSRDSRPTASDLVLINAAGIAVPNLTAGTRFALPEESTVYELGIKGNWGVASANLTVFKQSIKNFQDNVFTGTGFILGNADKQSTFGIEFDGRVNPTRELTLGLAMTYLRPKYDKYTNSTLGDISGTYDRRIPDISATYSMQYDQPLANDDHVIAHVDFHYESQVQVEPALLNYIVTNPDGSRNVAPARLAAQPFTHEVNDLNASLTYAMRIGLELSVFGRNILNKRYVTDIFDSVAQFQSVSGYLNQPRTYGVSARYRF